MFSILVTLFRLYGVLVAPEFNAVLIAQPIALIAGSPPLTQFAIDEGESLPFMCARCIARLRLWRNLRQEEHTCSGEQRAVESSPCTGLSAALTRPVLNRGATDRVVCPGGKLLEGAYVVTATGDSALFRLTRQHGAKGWQKAAVPLVLEIHGTHRLRAHPQRRCTARFRSLPHHQHSIFRTRSQRTITREGRGRGHTTSELPASVASRL